MANEAYFLFPLLIWAAVRFGQPGAVMATFCISFLAVAGTVQRWGPFAQPNIALSLFELQAFMGVAAVTMMILAAVTEEWHHARAALAASARRFRGLIEHSADGVILLDSMGTYLYCTPSVKRILGYELDELIGQDAFALCHPDDRARNQQMFGEVLSQPGRPVTDEYRYRHRDGSYHWLESTGVNWLAEPAIGGIVVNFRDITERKQAEERLRSALREKESLLKEVHHRVKNNLAIIDSLLRLQAGNLRDPVLATAMRESRNRIRSMASIHESLYRSCDVARIDFATYIENLCSNLFRSYGVDRKRIALRLEVAHVELDLEQAIPLGLLLNELVSNALKHAFPENRCGCIFVSLRRTDEGRIELTVADDGVGLPPDITMRRSQSLGLELVDLLTQQINGDLHDTSDGRTAFTVTFLPTPAKEARGVRPTA
jgi:PAS domain S-box-containing protein